MCASAVGSTRCPWQDAEGKRRLSEKSSWKIRGPTASASSPPSPLAGQTWNILISHPCRGSSSSLIPKTYIPLFFSLSWPDTQDCSSPSFSSTPLVSCQNHPKKQPYKSPWQGAAISLLLVISSSRKKDVSLAANCPKKTPEPRHASGSCLIPREECTCLGLCWPLCC